MSYISNNIDWYSMSDPAIIKELGQQLKRLRLKSNLTQQELSERSGLFRSTISEIENGRIASILSLIQILRALNQLELLNPFVAPDIVSPLMVAEQQIKLRRRASHKPDKKDESEW